MEEAPENGKESSHSAHANGMNDICTGIEFSLSLLLRKYLIPTFMLKVLLSKRQVGQACELSNTAALPCLS